MSKKICIISFSYLSRDQRVRRQILTLKKEGYDVTEVGIVGSGIQGVNSLSLSFNWYQKISLWRKVCNKVYGGFRLASGRIFKCVYEKIYWDKYVPKIFKALCNKKFDLYIANDLETLPLTIKLKKKNGGKVLFDSHEYSPLQLENRWYWNSLIFPYRDYLCKEYFPEVDSMITVCDSLADKYYQEYGIKPGVIRNIPFYYPANFKKTNPSQIRMIHHGYTPRGRRPENMIYLMRFLDSRFTLDFMLLNTDNNYLEELKGLAKKVGPHRINFRDPVPPDDIIRTLEDYDIDLCLFGPYAFNLKCTLPNKFFEFMMAGLCVVCGVSPEMGKIIKQYNCGIFIDKIDHKETAKTINRLTTVEIDKMKINSLSAAKELNGESEIKKISRIVAEL